MQDSNLFGLFLATGIASDLVRISEQSRSVCEPLLEEIDELVVEFLTQPITPQATFDFEAALQDRLREAGRRTVEVVFNQIEADDAQSAPPRVEWEDQEYSRKNNKTKNRGGIGTLFGEIMLRRFSYEPLQEARDDGQKSFSPLELLLGIVAGQPHNVQTILQAGERIINLQRAFACREGIRRKDDTLPKRLVTALPDGGAAGKAADLKYQLNEYYQLRGWDDKGIPTRERLQALGLSKVADDLH